MNAFLLAEAMGNISDDYISDAHEEVPQKKRFPFIAAAAAVIAFVGIISAKNYFSKNIDQIKAENKQTVPASNTSAAANALGLTENNAAEETALTPSENRKTPSHSETTQSFSLPGKALTSVSDATAVSEAGEGVSVNPESIAEETVTESVRQNGKTDTNGVAETFGADSAFTFSLSRLEKSKPKITGRGLTDEELKSYIEENAMSIVQPIAFDKAYGSGEYEVCLRGYCHAKVETDGSITVDRNFIDCPILKNDKIIGVVTLVNNGSFISNTVSYGGNGFDELQRAFDENPFSDMAFVYGYINPEIIISPENKMYFRPSPVDYDESVDYYSIFKTDYNTFSSKKLEDTVFVTISED